MGTARVALIATCLLVAGLGVWLVIARWDDANKVATAASALGAVAAVGVAVWAATRSSRVGKSIVVADTGQATAAGGGKAVSGLSGKTASLDGVVRVERTGDAESSGGDAITGAQFD